jgi:hypothetical protein
MRHSMLLPLAACWLSAADTVVRIDKAQPPPGWALAQRALLDAYSDAAREFAAKYLDERGYLLCVERWGGNDGPDDAMETFGNWPLFHALGGSDSVLDLYRKAWEGHLVQWTRAKAPSVEMAKDGMYYKEFVTAFDWEHTAEGLAAFHFYALSAPGDQAYLARVRRFAGLYMNEDPEAPNYDPRHKIIRSLHNGSRGPKLTPATEMDWGGEPVPGRPERLSRYSTASNIRGDHPLNLGACSLAFNAYALTGESKYRDWLLEYAGAWRDRVAANGGNIPTNIGLDGTIGGEWGGKWYGGTFGWNFWPQEGGRNYYMRGARTAFGEGFLLGRDARFVDMLRRQIANLYAARKEENGRILLPGKHGDNGWYAYSANQYFEVQRDIYLWSMDRADRKWLGRDPWLNYLDGADAGYPLRALEAEFDRLRRRVEAFRADRSSPDERASDSMQRFSPISTGTLVNLMLGGNDPGKDGNILHSRLRYFDPALRRAGLPEHVAALVEKIGADDVVVWLVNTSPVQRRKVVVQGGAYAEHQIASAEVGGKTAPVDKPHFLVDLPPGAGDRVKIAMRRYANPPTATMPWDR